MTLQEIQKEYSEAQFTLGKLVYESDVLGRQIGSNEAEIEKLQRRMRDLSKKASELPPATAEDVKIEQGN